MKQKNLVIMLFVISILLSACATGHMSQGLIYINQNDFGNAVSEFQAEARKKPSVEAYANLGAAYMRLGKNNLALEAFKKGESLNSNSTLLTYNMTALYSVTDKTDIALLYLDRTLKNGFDNYDAIRFDSDLSNLRGEPEFRTTLEKYKVFIQ